MALNCSLQSDLNHSTWGRETLQPQHPTACAPCDFGRISLLLQTGDPDRFHLMTQIVCESLCEAVALHSGDHVLHLAAGPVRIQGVGAEHLPFVDGQFDVALSTFGLTFARSPRRAVTDLLRAVKLGGRIGLASWTPDGFVGDLFRVMGHFVPAPGGGSPTVWGTETRLVELFGPFAREIHTVRKTYVFHYLSAAHWIEVFRRYYGPVHKAFAALDASGQRELHEAIVELLEKFNRGGRGALVVPAEYLQAVIRRA
jgi:SAM-dependent methyltransferase